METIVKAGQTFFDKVLECTGSIDNLFEMAALNGISPTQELETGQSLKASPVSNKAVVKLWTKNNVPATKIEMVAEENSNEYLLPGLFPYSL